EAETEPQQRIRHLAVLVEARRHADRIGEVEPESAHRETRIVACARQDRRNAQAEDREAMRVLGIKLPQQRPRQRLEQPDHGASSGNMWTPSDPNGSGLAHSTASSVSTPYRCGNSAPPREGSHFNAGPSAAAATATRTRSAIPAKCRAAVSATCS